MLLSHQSIPLNSINFSTDWNLHPWEYRVISPELEESFSISGVIHPPILIADSEKTFVIISGAKRVEFIRRSVGPSNINCLVVDKNAPHTFILDLILADQTSAPKLSLAEKARFVEIASQFLEKQEIASSFLKKIQLKEGRSTISNLLEILKLNEIIIKEIHAGRLLDKMVSELLSLTHETDRLSLAQLFVKLGMGTSKQKRFFNLIRDIAFREGVTITSYLQKDEILEILDHQEMNVPQKIQHLGNFLQQAITPVSLLAEEDFVKQVAGLQLASNHSISHSPSFEKDEVTLSITFKDFAACAQYLSQQKK